MRSWRLLVGAVVCEVAATLALKAALERPPLYVVVVAGYVLALLLLALVLRAGMSLGVAYGTWCALGVASTALLSAVLFDEDVTGRMMVGIVLVIAGVLVIEIGSDRAHGRAVDGGAWQRPSRGVPGHECGLPDQRNSC